MCVYVSLPGFASTDKQHADLKAYEGVLLAESGVFMLCSVPATTAARSELESGLAGVK